MPSETGEDITRIDEHDTDTADVRRPRVRVDRIPPIAWNAADRFRALVLARQPTNALHRRPWGGQKGLRAKWADSFRLLIEVDKRVWADVKRVVEFLFEQPNTFVVLSPDSLRVKWDRLMLAIDRGIAPPPSRNADNRPPPVFRQVKGDDW